MKIRKLLNRPLESAEELEKLAAWVAEKRAHHVWRLKGAAVAAAITIVANLATTAFRSSVDPTGRLFSLIVVMAFAMLLAPGTMRHLRTRPRLLAAQRQLLRHRGLAADEGPDSLGEEIERLAKRIRKRFGALERDDSLLADAERRAYVLLARLARNEEGATTGLRESLHTEQVRLRSRLEAFRVALANMEVEALLRPDFYAGDGAREALLAAATLLEDDPVVVEGTATGSGAWKARSATGNAVPRGLIGTVPPAHAGTDVLEIPPIPPEGEGSGTTLLRPDFSAARASIAVLPFADLSPEQDQEYFCHGLAEELINALTQIGELRVIARASSFAFLGERRDVREVGHALGVDTVVEGSVRKSGERLRITVRLIHTADGQQLWSERYDRGAGDVFAIQDEITASLVDHLTSELGPARLVQDRLGHDTPYPKAVVRDGGTGPASRRRPKADLDAYHVYLKARHHWNRRTPPELHKSAELFQQAIARDPDFALAHAGLADAYVLLGFYSVLAPQEAFPKAITAATQALEIDAELAEAHAPLAFASLLYQWDWPGAEKSFRQALAANPGYATTHHWYAEYLALMGRHEEAIDRARIARELDPLSPVVLTLTGWVYYYARRHGEAIAALEKTLELEAGFAPAQFWLALAHAERGEPEVAVGILRQALEGSDRSTMFLAAIGRLEAVLGHREEAVEVLGRLEEASRERYVPPYYCAAVHLACGEVDDSFGCLERAFQDRDNWLAFLKVDPIWDPVREDPRFGAMLHRVGFR